MYCRSLQRGVGLQGGWGVKIITPLFVLRETSFPDIGFMDAGLRSLSAGI